MYNIRHTNRGTTRSTEPYMAKKISYLTMNLNIKGTGNPMLDYCDDTSIYAIMNSVVVNTMDTVIINDLVGVSQTESKATLVGFGHGLSIMNVYSTAAIDLPNGVVIAHQNGYSLIQIGSNFLVYTAQ